jgi:transcription initiation factor TFIIH subunit 2
MPDSDDEYIQNISDEDVEAHLVTRSKGRRRRNSQPVGSTVRGADDGKSGGFEVSRTWETVVEGEDGTISGAIEGLLEAGKRRRSEISTMPSH